MIVHWRTCIELEKTILKDMNNAHLNIFVKYGGEYETICLVLYSYTQCKRYL
jgi:hypothetical protein